MAEADSGSKKRTWPMVVMAIVTTAAIATALFLVFERDNPIAMPAMAQEKNVDPIFLPIQPFTANLADDAAGSRLVYAGITLKLNSEKTLEVMEKRMPQLRSRLLTLFSGKSSTQLTSPDDKDALVVEIAAALQAPLEAEHPTASIDDVLFTEFIIQ